MLLLTRFDGGVRLIWNEELDESSAPTSTAFTVTVNGVIRDSGGSINGNVVAIGLEGVVNPTDVLTVSYTAPTGSGAMPLRDSAGNNAASFSAQMVRNDRIQVAFTSDPGPDKTYSWNSGYGKQDVIEATVTFSEPVLVSGVPELKLEVGSEARRATYHSGSGTTSLIFRYAVTQGETDTDGIWIRSSGSLSKLTGPGLVRYASTKATAPARSGRLQSDHLVDGVRPTLVSADALANGNDVTLRWDKALDEASATKTHLFTVENTSDNSSLEITAISIQGQVVSLTLSSAVSATDELTVSYYDPFGHVPESVLMQVNHKPLKDTVGNSAVKISSAVVSVTQNPNSPPEFPSSEDGARSVDENTPTNRNIGTAIAADDADNNRLTYTISGTDAAFFDVVATSGQLRTRDALDHESRDSYSFTMSVHDGKDVHGNADTTIDDTISVTVTVEDVDEPPVITGVTTIGDYDENGTGDVATYTAIDPEGDSNIAWSLAGPDWGDFDITGGVLTFKNVPDYERPADSGGNNQYEVIVQATDSNNKRGELHLDVIVTNVDELPELTGPDTVDDFPENSAISRQVGRYTASDPEGATVTMSLTVGGTDFSLAGNGVLTFRESPDYEQQRSYSVTVRAEAGSHTVDRVVAVNIQNVEEPGAVTLSTVQPQEGTELTATLDDGDEPTGTTWQWYRTSSRGSTGAAITNANSRAYTPGSGDVGSYLRAVGLLRRRPQRRQVGHRRQRQPGAGSSAGTGAARVPCGRRLRSQHPVSDDEGRPVPHHVRHRLVYLRLCSNVDAGCGVVQDQDGSVQEYRAGDDKPLPLTAGKGYPALAHPRFVTVRQALDEPVKLGSLGRPHHVVHGRFVDPVGDVVPYSRREGEHILEHNADAAPQRIEGDFADVHAVDEDPARRGVVEAGQQVRDRALAGAGGANDGSRLTGPQLEAHVVQCRDIPAVFEGHRVEGDASPGRQVPGLPGDRERVLRVQHLEDPLARSRGPGKQVHPPLHPMNRSGQRHEVDHERRQRARSQDALLHLPSAQQQYPGYHQREQHHQDGLSGHR